MSTPSRNTRSASRQPERSPRARTPSRADSASKRTSSSSKKKSSSSRSNKKSPARSPARSTKKSPARTQSPARSQKKSSSSSRSSRNDTQEKVRQSVEAAADAARRTSSSARKELSDAADDARTSVYETSTTVSRSVHRTRSRLEDEAEELTSSAATVTNRLRQLAEEAAEEARREFESVKDEIERVTSVGPPLAGRRGARTADAEMHEELPTVALLPPIAVYSALVLLAHVLVLFAFSKESLQLQLSGWLSGLSLGLASSDSIKHWLIVTNVNHIAFFVVVPLYVAAGLLLQQGVRHVFGGSNKGGRTQAFAANVARVVSAVAFVLTVAAYTEWDQHNSREGLNALVVLQFAFMFQEFLLGFSRFTTARNIYSLLYLVLTGYKAVQAYNFRAGFITSPQALPLDVALSYALLTVNTSDNLAAVAGVFAGLSLNTAASIWLTLQSIVNFGVTFIMSVSIYQKHGALFPDEAEYKQPTILESSAAAFVMCAFVFLLVTDSHFVPYTRARVSKKTR